MNSLEKLQRKQTKASPAIKRVQAAQHRVSILAQGRMVQRNEQCSLGTWHLMDALGDLLALECTIARYGAA